MSRLGSGLFNGALVKRERDTLKSTLNKFDLFGSDGTYASGYRVVGKTLIIAHVCSGTDSGIQVDTVEQAKNVVRYTPLFDNLMNYITKIIHIVPEVGKGRMDGLFNVDHIRLRIIEEEGKNDQKKFTRCSNQLIDPRDVAQGTFDTVNCGRYVAAMAAEAAGLAAAGVPITINSLKQSPIVQDAALFTTEESLRSAVEFASKNPINNGEQAARRDEIIAAIRQIKQSYELRVAEGNKYKTVFGKVFGYSAQEKLDALNAIMPNINGDTPKLSTNKQAYTAAAFKGRLGDLVKELKKLDSEPSSNPKNDGKPTLKR